MTGNVIDLAVAVILAGAVSLVVKGFVSDIMMPVMNGLETLEVIRKSKDLMGLPVILISAVAERADVARGIRMGANDYISKPVDIDVVTARVKTQVMIKQLVDVLSSHSYQQDRFQRQLRHHEGYQIHPWKNFHSTLVNRGI